MSTYRLKPAASRSWWWALFGTTTVVLAIPVALNLVVPDRHLTDEVRLGSDGYSWEIPLDMTCRTSTQVATGDGWYCGDVRVQSVIAEGGTEPDRTLRRMMRALNFTMPPEDAVVLREDDARMIVDDRVNTIGLSLEGTGDREGLTMIAVLTGPGDQVAPIADRVWRSYTDGRELPAVVVEAITGLESTTALPWSVAV